MTAILTACLGLLLASRLPELPSPCLALLTLLPALLPRMWRPGLRCVPTFLLGLGWGIGAGHALLQHQLSADLEGEDLLISGYVSSLPEDRGDYWRFEVVVSDYHNLRPGYVAENQLPQRLLLSWYGQSRVRAGDAWTLRVRLRRPRGFVNEGGFDYQRWLLGRGIGATGYVRPSSHNEPADSPRGWVLGMRESIRESLRGSTAGDSAALPLLTALTVGDRSAIAPAQWELLRDTGTVHLMAISGLHVGLLALAGYWLGRVIASLLGLRRPGFPPGILPALCSLLLAGGYAALAGFALPTQRALAMVAVVNLCLLLGRSVAAATALLWALLAVLLLDPLAGYEMGFWLSFVAVAMLLYRFRGRAEAGQRARGPWGRAAGFGWAQWAVFAGLSLPLLALNQDLSLLAPLANLVAIPVVSLLVVPPLLLGLALLPLWESAAVWLVSGAAAAMEGLWHVLGGLRDSWPRSAYGVQPPGPVPLLLALVGVLLLLGPRGLPARGLAPLLLLPLLLPAPAQRAPLRLTVLDVGQGLATVVSTPRGVLVYDAGPAYSEGFNAGEAIVAPHLRARGIDRIERLVISHGDNDHAGGAVPLLAALPVDQLFWGEPLPAVTERWPRLPAVSCGGQRWRWGEVRFRLIRASLPADADANDRSCLLSVRYRGQHILLAGDVEGAAEQTLLAAGVLPRDVTLLQAPHHGSASSSTAPFVRRLRPDHVVYSAAFHSPHGHPHPEVQGRYRAAGSAAHHTGRQGQLDFIWDDAGQLRVSHRREGMRRYWYSPAPGCSRVC